MRISFITIDITNISSGNCNIDEFLASSRIINSNQHLITNYTNNEDPLNAYSSIIKTTSYSENPMNVYRFIKTIFYSESKMIWIPYSQIKNLSKIAEGGFSIIYKATWSDGINDTDVAIKKLFDSQNISKYFLNEVIFYCIFAMCFI